MSKSPGTFRKRLVVDTDVVCSASDSTVVPRSLTALNVLETILSVGHSIVISQAIIKEWRDHCSNYSSTWLVKMRRKNKIVQLKMSDLNFPELKKQIPSKKLTLKQNQAVKKDILLLEAALATDRRVISMDNEVRTCLCKAQLDEVKNILWVNPEDAEDNCLNWLKSGAPDVHHLHLGHSY